MNHNKTNNLALSQLKPNALSDAIEYLDEVWIPRYKHQNDEWGIESARQKRNFLSAKLELYRLNWLDRD